MTGDKSVQAGSRGVCPTAGSRRQCGRAGRGGLARRWYCIAAVGGRVDAVRPCSHGTRGFARSAAGGSAGVVKETGFSAIRKGAGHGNGIRFGDFEVCTAPQAGTFVGIVQRFARRIVAGACGRACCGAIPVKPPGRRRERRVSAKKTSLPLCGRLVIRRESAAIVWLWYRPRRSLRRSACRCRRPRGRWRPSG